MGHKSRTPRSYFRRHLLALSRLALYATVCGLFFELGLQIGKHNRDFDVSWPNMSILSAYLKAAEDEELEAQWKEQGTNDQIVGILPVPNMMNPGEMGRPFRPSRLTEEQKKMVEKGWLNNGFNQYVSDLISVNRTLPDVRNPRCKEPGRFLSNLPKASVIFIFHNEAWSVLLRSVHSVLNRSPPELIKEIILVDDNSTMPHLKTQLEEYMSKFPKVRIVRAPTRVGLIRARMLGSDVARGRVLVFLDSHIEATAGWLPPLLDRIARNFTNVVVPVIDTIQDDTFEYHYDKSPPGFEHRPIGIFEWSLTHNWAALSEREKKKHNDTSEPYASPTMAGGLFAISRRFWEYLGKYDPAFDIWGGENLELSFKTWMCGGRLEQVPCSHVGHIFRKRAPYKGREGVKYVQLNLVRLAKVWLDGYAKYFYMRIGNDLGNYGDISERVALRQRLKCKSFRWYLENVYPEIFIPDNGYGFGEIRNLGFGNSTCLDATMDHNDMMKPVGVYPCHRQGGNQVFSFTADYEIRRDTMCVDYPGETVITYPCHGARGNQEWRYIRERKWIQHYATQKCLTLTPPAKLVMEACDPYHDGQRWLLENYRPTPKEDRFALD